MILTYVVLAWELSFVLLVLFPRTRRIVILIGVALHLGMTLVLEVGLFPWMMFASYTSFLDPERVPMLCRSLLKESVATGAISANALRCLVTAL